MSIFSKKIIGLDFHDYYAQVLELEMSGSETSLMAFNRISIPPQVIRNGEIISKDKLKDIIKTLLETSNPRPIKGKKVVCSFPAKKIFTHIFKFPLGLSSKEIAKALPFEAENIIPFELKDIYWDFRILYEDDKKINHASQYVLFAGIQKEIADNYVELISSLGLRAYAFTIPAECAENALRIQLSKAQSSLVIDVGSLATVYSVFNGTDLREVSTSMESGKSLVRELAEQLKVQEIDIINQKENNAIDPKSLPKVIDFEDKIFNEAKKILKEHDVNTIFITGEFLNLPGFYENAKKAFPNKEILAGDPCIGINTTANKFLPLDASKGFSPYSVYFTTAIGLSLRGLNIDQAGINLLPDFLKASFASRKLSIFLGIASVFLVMVSFVLSTLVILKHQELSFMRLEVEAKKSSLQQLIYGTRYQEIKKAITDFNSEVQELTTIQSSMFSVPELLKNIFGAIPEGTTISSFEFNDKDLSVNINGISDNRDTLLNTRKALENSPYVEKVVAPLSNFDEKENISFSLKLTLKFNKLKPYAWNEGIK